MSDDTTRRRTIPQTELHETAVSSTSIRPKLDRSHNGLDYYTKPKIIVWNGSKSPQATIVACPLVKAVDGRNNMGLGKFEVDYLRDKKKHEIDFLVALDSESMILFR